MWVTPNGREHRTIKDLETYAPGKVSVSYQTLVPEDKGIPLRTWNLMESNFKAFIKEHRLTLLQNKAN